jgi:hypothetical protein
MEFSSRSLVSRFLAGDNREYEAWVRNVPGSGVAVDGFLVQVICAALSWLPRSLHCSAAKDAAAPVGMTAYEKRETREHRLKPVLRSLLLV